MRKRETVLSALCSPKLPAANVQRNVVESTGSKAKYLSDSLTLQICQEVYKNVIVSQLLVIIFLFLWLLLVCMYVCVCNIYYAPTPQSKE